MTFNPNDPKWTAYVAGELDAAQRSAVEQELAQSSEARALVADIENVIGTLVTQLKTEPIPTAPAAMLVERSSSATTAPLPKARLLYISVIGSAAAAAALLGVGLYWNAHNSNWRDVALNSSTTQTYPHYPMAAEAPPANEKLGEVALSPQRDSYRRDRALDGVADDVLTFDDHTKNKKSAAPAKDEFRYAPQFGAAGSGNVANTPFPNHAGGKTLESREESSQGDKQRDSDYTVTKPQYETKTKEIAPAVTLPALPMPEPKPNLSGNAHPKGEAGLRGAVVLDEPTPSAQPTSSTTPRPERESAETPKPIATAPPTRPTPASQPTDPAAPAKPGAPASLYPNGVQAGLSVAPGPSATTAVPAPNQQAAVSGKEGRWAEYDRAVPQPDSNRPQPREDLGGEAYEQVTDNAFMPARENPLSTFSIDVDTASYSNIRRFLTQNRMLPPPAAVRIEEMVNYFRYDYPQPEGETPFQANIEVASCPWNSEHRLARVGIKGREIASNKRPPSNLVFLVDVSGSMSPANKLPLVKEGLKMLTRQLTENDRIAIVVYAGSSGLVLPSTTGDKQQTILDALDRLEAGGSTNGAQGIQLAYEIALQNFLKGCTNRVILATDGDFNVGVTDRGQLVSLIEQQAKTGVFLTTLGFGMGNIKDATLEQLADKGNGAYAYVDDLREAKKVLVDEMSGTLVTIAKDVKIQIEFNPAEVGAYRLIGYENRIMKHEDFNNDQKDAGEIGAGHTVTALYELVPVGKVVADRPTVDPLKYQPKVEAKAETPKAEPVAGEHAGELLTLKLRYKQPDGDTSKLLEYPVKDSGQRWAQATGDFKFAASVALFGMILRNSPHKGTATLDAVAELANEGRGSDESGYRQEFISLVQTAKSLGK